MAKQNAFWVSDSAGVDSLHVNGPNLTKDQSYLGHIARIEGEWFFIKKGTAKPIGPFGTFAQAKREGMLACDVEYL